MVAEGSVEVETHGGGHTDLELVFGAAVRDDLPVVLAGGEPAAAHRRPEHVGCLLQHHQLSPVLKLQALSPTGVVPDHLEVAAAPLLAALLVAPEALYSILPAAVCSLSGLVLAE